MISLMVLAIWLLGSFLFSLLIGGILSFTHEAGTAEPKARFPSEGGPVAPVEARGRLEAPQGLASRPRAGEDLASCS
jgi:hypothetical protein